MAAVISYIRLGGVWRLVGSAYTPPTGGDGLVTEAGTALLTESGDAINA